MRGLVKLFLELGVLPVRPDVMLESMACFSRGANPRLGRRSGGKKTHWTPPGCREVLLTLLEITKAFKVSNPATVKRADEADEDSRQDM